MTCYEIRLWVTIEQETAIIELFKHQSWTYSRLDSQYTCNYAYQSEENTRVSNDYLTQVEDSTSTTTQPVCENRFDDSGGSFLSWLQNQDVTGETIHDKNVTGETIHDKRNDSNIVEKSCSHKNVDCDPNQGFELRSQHDVYSEKIFSNTESKESNDSSVCRETQMYVERLPCSSSDKSANLEINLIAYQGPCSDVGDSQTTKQDNTQLVESQPNINVPSISAQSIKPCGDSFPLKNIPDTLQNDRPASSLDNESVAYKLNAAVETKLESSEINAKVTHTGDKVIVPGTLNNLNEPFSENHLDSNLNRTLQKYVSEVVSTTLTKSDENSEAVIENKVSEAKETGDKADKYCKVDLGHEFNSSIKKLRNRLDHAISRGKLKRKLEKEIDELSKLESLFDTLAEIEIQVDKISRYKSTKSSCKKDASGSHLSSGENETNVKELERISTRFRTKLRNKLKNNAKKSRDKITDKVGITCINCDQSFKHQNNYDDHLEEGNCERKTKSQNKDSGDAYESSEVSCSANKNNKGSVGANKRVDIYCQECEHTFKYKKNYDKHLEEDKCRHVCEYCGKIFLSGETGNYKIHLKYHTKQTDHECLICGKQYVEFRKLKEHYRKHSGEAPYQCDECGRTFSGFTGLYSHKKTNHSGVTEKFCCSQCPKVFLRYSGLTFHMKYYHQAESDKPYSCLKCNKTFRTPDLLKRHETTHRETKDFKCDQCSAAFRRIQGLTEHKRRHVKNFGHFCAHCGKGFYTRQSRLVHERVHTGEKPYQCRLCSYSCALNGNLKKHMKTHNHHVNMQI